MKTTVAVLSSCLLWANTLGGPLRAGPVAEPETTELSEPRDLGQLKAEYERKRAEALRPVAAWYRAQLEVLARRSERESQAVAAAQAKLAETFWQEDQPELKQALLEPHWLWRSELDADGVALHFQEDGTVHHVGLNGTWKITGPNEVTVQPEDDAPFILRLDASLKSFTGNRRGVTGDRSGVEP